MMTGFLDQISITFKALGDPKRLKILRLVAARKHNFYVAEIAEKLGISSAAVSQHLKVLKNAGIVEPAREGYHTFYRMRKGAAENFRKNVDRLIRVGFLDCTFDGPCSECPDKGSCMKE
jgi:DNA-binding transcriptional ArsR family regulator